MARVAVIGDVHGHLTQMLAAIEHAELAGVDRIILLGDLIDRGPRSIACLRAAQRWTFRTRSGKRRAVEVVCGNHEDAYVRIADGEPKPGRAHVSQPEDRPLYRRLSHDDLMWMRQLPYYIEIPELGVTCLHGGVTPYQWDLDEAGARVLRTRYLDDGGRPLRSITTSDWFWADTYNGRFGTIVFGHEGHIRPTRYDHAIAIDGEGFQRLHGVILSNEAGDCAEAGFTIAYGSRRVTTRVRMSESPARAHDVRRMRNRQRTFWPEVG